MKGLSGNRYACVLLEQSPVDVILYYWPALPTLFKEARLLRLKKANAESGRRLSLKVDQFFNQDLDLELPDDESCIEEIQNLGLKAVQIPSTLNRLDFTSWFKSKFYSFTEMFDQTWNNLSLGSSRSILLTNLQIKGCGRTLPPHTFWQPESSGLFNLEAAILSFIHSHLADTTLPLGSCKSYGVLSLRNDHRAGLYLRENHFPRLIQLGPSIEEERKSGLIRELTEFHGSKNPNLWMKKIIFQFASMAFMGANFNMTPDNILINGQPIDEENWVWPKNLNEWKFRVIYEFPEGTNDNSSKDFDGAVYKSGAFKQFEDSLKAIRKCLLFLTDFSITEDEVVQDFRRKLEQLSEESGFSHEWEKLLFIERTFLKENPKKGVQLIKAMSYKSESILIDEKKLLVSFSRERTKKYKHVAQTFNERNKVSPETLMRRIWSSLAVTEKGLSASDLSRISGSYIARSSFILNKAMNSLGELEDNILHFETWWNLIHKDNFYEGDIIGCFVWDGTREKRITSKEKSSFPETFIPISLEIQKPNGSKYEIALQKRVITNPLKDGEAYDN